MLCLQPSELIASESVVIINLSFSIVCALEGYHWLAVHVLKDNFLSQAFYL